MLRERFLGIETTTALICSWLAEEGGMTDTRTLSAREGLYFEEFVEGAEVTIFDK